MRRIILFLIIPIGFIQPAFSQVSHQDSVKVYNACAKRGIIKMVYAYMRDCKDTYAKHNKKFGSKEKRGLNRYKNVYIDHLNNIDEKSTDSLFKLVKRFLPKNGWASCEKNIYQQLVAKFERTSPSNFNEGFFNKSKRKLSGGKMVPLDFIPNKSGNNINDRHEWKETAKNIIQKYKKSLESLAANHTMDTAKTKDSISHQNNETHNNSDTQITNTIATTQPTIINKSSQSYVSIIIAIMISVIIGYVIGRKLVLSRLEKEIDYIIHGKSIIPSFKLSKKIKKMRPISHTEHQRLLNEVSELKMKYAFLNSENNELKKKIYVLEQKLSKHESVENLLKSNETKDLESSNSDLSTRDFTDQVKKASSYEGAERNNSFHKKSAALFFSMPESDGSFKIANGEPSNDGRRYFKIEYDPSSNQGELFFLTSERDQRAINRLESYLKPVCEIGNIQNSTNSTKIELIKSGKVFLNNDKWMIDTKNKVKIKLY